MLLMLVVMGVFCIICGILAAVLHHVLKNKIDSDDENLDNEEGGEKKE